MPSTLTTRDWSPTLRRYRRLGWCLLFALCAVPASAQAQVPRTPAAARGAAFAPPLFPAELRRSVVLGAGPAAPVVASGRRVFLALRSAALVAVDVDAGALAWRAPLAATHAPILAGDRLVVATADTLEAVTTAEGQSVWRVPLPAPPAAPPLALDGLAVVALATGDVLAVNVEDGAVRWKASLGAPAVNAAAGDARALYFAVEGGVVALGAVDGRQQWTQRLGGRPTGLSLSGDRLYAGSLDNFLYGLDPATGRIRWRWRTGGDIAGAPVADAERVYFSSLDNLLRALDRNSGVQRWKLGLGARPLFSPVLVARTLLLVGQSPEVQAAWAESGKPAGRYGLDADPGAAPVFLPGTWVGDDLLALPTAEGQLVLIGRRLSPSVAAPAALPGLAVPVTVTPPPQ